MVAPSNSAPSSFTRLLTKLDIWFQGTAKNSYKLGPSVAPANNRNFFLVDPGADCNLVTSRNNGGQTLGLGAAVPLGAILVGNGGNELQLLIPANPADDGKTLVFDHTVSGGWKLSAAAGGSGDVVGPAGATDHSLALFSGATGKLIKTGPALGGAGDVLTSNGAGADPSFQTPAAVDADLVAIAALSTTGMLARTAANTWALRTIAAVNSKIIVNNGDGVAGAPTIDFGSVASTDLSDTANIALKNNANSWSVAQTPSAVGTIDLGSTALPFRNLIFGGAATNNTKLASAVTTAQRTCTFPDANSNPVIPDTGAANNFLTAISSGGVISKAQPSSSNLSDSSNVALRNNANSWSVAQTPNAVNTIDLGTTALPFRNLIIGTAATNNNKIVSAVTTAQRTFTLPDANSNSVIPDTGAANNFLTAISSGGVISKAQPAFSNISGTGTIAQGCTNNGSLGVSALGIYAGDGSKLIQVVGSALQNFRVNAGGTAIEAFTPAGGTTSNYLRYKPSDETRTSTTTPSNDADLSFPIAAGEVWTFALNLGAISTINTPDFLLTFVGPSGCTIDFAGFASGGGVFGGLAGGATATVDLAGNALQTVVVSGKITNSSTSGTCNFQWSQAVSSATATTLKRGSWMKATLN